MHISVTVCISLKSTHITEICAFQHFSVYFSISMAISLKSAHFSVHFNYSVHSMCISMKCPVFCLKCDCLVLIDFIHPLKAICGETFVAWATVGPLRYNLPIGNSHQDRCCHFANSSGPGSIPLCQHNIPKNPNYDLALLPLQTMSTV